MPSPYAKNPAKIRPFTCQISAVHHNNLCQRSGLADSISMKSLTEHLWFEIPSRRGYENITATVEELVRKSGVSEGLCLVNAMHITKST